MVVNKANNDYLRFDKSMSFHPRTFFQDNESLKKILSNEPYSVAEAFSSQVYEDATSKYHATDLPALVQSQDHLSSTTKSELLAILMSHQSLFSGLDDRQLGIFPNREYHIDLLPNAKPFHIKQPYSIPIHQQEAVKKELLRWSRFVFLKLFFEFGER